MIFDKKVMLADGLAFGATGPSLDVGQAKPPDHGQGRGSGVLVYLTGDSLAAAGDVFIVVEGSNNDADWGTDMTIGIAHQEAEDGGVSFNLPSNISQYVRIRLTGLTAGTITAGIVIDAL